MYTALIHFFFFNDTATTEIYTLSLHDALPIFSDDPLLVHLEAEGVVLRVRIDGRPAWCDRRLLARIHRYTLEDRKSTRLNSSHANISYAVFCLKKKRMRILTCLMQ